MEPKLISKQHNTSSPANNQCDLYTIPARSSWFNWEEIHEIERTSLKEFFNWSSFTRTPKIYKEYRDFIINKFREDVKHKLRFTDVRKSLVGDITLIHKVFKFLETWGLINYGVEADEVAKDVKERPVKVEEGAPNGIRVSAYLNSTKAVSTKPDLEGGNNGGEAGEDKEEVKIVLAPLASHSDVFKGESGWKKVVVCGICGGECGADGYYESSKEASIACIKCYCIKCYNNENHEEKRSTSNFKFKEGLKPHVKSYWTDEETLLLLESVMKHGDNWELVSKNVQSKTTSECILRLIELPFGELVLDANSTGDLKRVQSAIVEPQEKITEPDHQNKQTSEIEPLKNDENKEPPSKKRCINSIAEVGDSLMKQILMQVALLSTAVSPSVAAAAAEASITTLCYENQYSRLIFEGKEDCVTDLLASNGVENGQKRVNDEAMEMEETHPLSENHVGSSEMKSKVATLKIRAAVATALGAAAARAKLLADQEEREIELLVATVIEAQLRKINCKTKHFDDLELIMEKEYAQIQKLKESVIDEQVDVLRRTFGSKVSRWRDHNPQNSLVNDI